MVWLICIQGQIGDCVIALLNRMREPPISLTSLPLSFPPSLSRVSSSSVHERGHILLDFRGVFTVIWSGNGGPNPPVVLRDS
jgi:hypothetical protein